MDKFKSRSEAQNHFTHISLENTKKKFPVLNFSQSDLEILSIDELQQKIKFIDNILVNHKFDLHSNYRIGIDFFGDDFLDSNDRFLSFSYNSANFLIDKKREILNIIRTKEIEENIKSIDELIKSVPQLELKQKLSQEVKKFEEQEEKFKIEEKQLQVQKEEEQFNSEKKKLELQQSKLEIFDKKSQVWLRIFGKESIASILGGFLLLVMSISFIVAMFTGTEISNIVESAFLLILGYFFGQSVKNDK